ncbi:hypothetical protein BpHYR1_017198 [Brachionus plicatilis]|uniref:Uncharacterized protein n=1 Tax=Brachionus plicatilis TaxID=10195 RepID=A0A3M7PKX9_BRAPC|nr:hypothetical protein BpHYR1_017198 [Brachionus plicatilis]
MKSSFHELLHLVDLTFQIGSLKSTCLFQYEELNRKITRLIKAQYLVADEFIKLYSISQSLQFYISDKNIGDKNVNSFINKNFDEKWGSWFTGFETISENYIMEIGEESIKIADRLEYEKSFDKLNTVQNTFDYNKFAYANIDKDLEPFG